MAVQEPAGSLYGQLMRPGLPAMVSLVPTVLDAAWEALSDSLMRSLGRDRVLRDPGSLMAYSYDATGERHLPRVVVVPDEAGEVGTALSLAAVAGVPVLARGAGTNLSGGAMPLYGGAVLALQRLQGPLTVDRRHLSARVPAGVVNADLQERLAPAGLFFAPDPSSHRISTLGGNVQENSGGPHCVKYGVTASHVDALFGFLADGTPLRLCRPAIPGELDLLGLVIGSEGTLVIGIAADLSLRVRPPATATALIAFASVAAALDAVAAIVAARLEPSSLELLDRVSMELVEPFVHAGYPTAAEAVLLVEVEGRVEDLSDRLDELDRTSAGAGRLEFRSATSAEAAERLWRGRRAAYGALARKSAHIFVQDVTVPRPHLAEMMAEVTEIGRRFDLVIATVAHAGDGNLHPSIAYDPADPDQLHRLHAADGEILRRAADRDGSITGEHGIGIDKLEHLPLMYSAAELAVMKQLKRVFDPNLRLNPGKAIWTGEDLDRSSQAMRAPSDGVRLLMAAIAEARATGTPLFIRGSSIQCPAPPGRILRVGAMFSGAGAISVDRDNLTARVGAGVTVAELDGVLMPLGLEWAVDALDPEETLGGVIAGGMPALRDTGPGPVRDQVLGVEMVDGAGRYLRFGRPVLKNVAGYDVTKLLVGSRGRLGILCRADLRLRPRRSLQWRALSLPRDHISNRAWELLSDFARPEAILSRPGQIITAWATPPAGGVGDPIADPRAELASTLREALGRSGLWVRLERGTAPKGSYVCWWPFSGVVLDVSGTGSYPVVDPLVARLERGIVDVFDPDRILSGGQTHESSPA